MVDARLPLHGGYAYQWKYPLPRAFADARVPRLWRDGETVSFRARVVERDVVALNNGRAVVVG